MPVNNKNIGYIYGVVAAAAYGLNPVFALPLLESGMDAMSILFFRYLLAIPAVWLLMRLRGRHAAIGAERILPICGLGVVMAVSSITLFQSYLYMDVGIASTLLFVYPLIVMLIMVGFFHEIMLLPTFICMLGALVGVWLLCATPEDGSVSTIGIILVMLSALSYAIYIVGINRRPVKSVATLSITFWVLVSGVIVIGAFLLFKGSVAVPRGFLQWGAVILLALVPTVLSFLCTNAAIEKIGSTGTAVLGVFEPVTAVIFGVLMFGETLTLRSILGLVLILVCVTIVIARGNLTRQILAIRKLFPIVKKHHRRR